MAGTPPPPRPPARPRLRAMAAPLLLALACLLVYNANLRQIGAGDTLAARYLPLLLWRGGALDLQASARLVAHGHPMAQPRGRPADSAGRAAYYEPTAYWMVRTRQHQLASFYPVVTPLLVAPLYLPAAAWLDASGWEPPNVDRAAELMEKIAASALAAAASALMLLALRRDAGRWALPLAAAFAFGTNTWMISSQALWQHGTGELLVALALLLATGPASPGRTALLGAACALMPANRPPDGLIAVAVVLAVAWGRRRGALWMLAGAAVPLAALMWYNLGFIGSVAGGYTAVKPPKNFFQQDWSGVAGLLVSPARGLLVFTPFLAFVPWGLARRLRAPGTRWLAAALGLAVAAQVVLYSQGDWRGGASWGPRWLTDVLPILVWMLAPAPAAMRPAARGLLALAIVASVGVQAAGAFWYTGTSDERIFAPGPSPMSGAWDIGNVPFLAELRHPPAPPELQCDARGSIDLVGQALRPTPADSPALAPGDSVEGWALACGRAPAQALLLVDGAVVGTTAEFLPRPDVSAALGTPAPSGWRIAASTWGVAPGERVLQLAVRVAPRGDFRIVREQRVTVAAQWPPPPAAQPEASAPELAAMAARAAELLRGRQSAEGYWLTAYTAGTRYESPRPEMNTYTTAMLVDSLAPVAGRLGLGEALARARAHLAAQVEGGGLVRYHGLPDAPTIGTLGCAITPDSDDTALAWRVAGLSAEDPRRGRMLAELARYRDSRGLYRTWLAPQERYQCIDPGSDPDPTDVAIQMHVYLMLRELDPPAAERLCTALRRASGDEDIWVYYAKTALVPYIRAAELQGLGCAVPLPAERLALPAAGQEDWSEAARLLVAATGSPEDAGVRREIRGLLTRLGQGDFALLRGAPPLLYHNDLSASVRRYYWSEDVGYALWLRLYEVSK